jgi:hypothetical protein
VGIRERFEGTSNNQSFLNPTSIKIFLSQSHCI